MLGAFALSSGITMRTIIKPCASRRSSSAVYLGDIYTVSVNMAGSAGHGLVPCGFDGAGLPVGAQMIAPAFGEQRLFDAACAYQARTAFHRARPKED